MVEVIPGEEGVKGEMPREALAHDSRAVKPR
jgi:hypothetical protein